MLMILVTVLGINYAEDGLREALDPRMTLIFIFSLHYLYAAFIRFVIRYSEKKR